MSDIGTKTSLKGYDVKNCADYELLFSSSWPLLKIKYQGSFTISDATQDVVIKTHNLGYIPVFWVFDTSDYAGGTAGTSSISVSGTSQYLGMNSTHLKWLGATRSAYAGTMSGRYYIFENDLTASYTAPVIKSTGTTKGTDGDWGIKISSEGNSILSSDYKNFVIHSSTKSPLVHMTGEVRHLGTPGVSTITHNLGYEPMFLFYGNIDAYADNYYQAIFSADDSSAQATSTTISCYFGGDADLAYLILKDPF